jgi:DNA polymerase-4
MAFLAPRPVGMLWGVGKALQAKMRRDGITTIGQLQERSEFDLASRYGSIGARLYRFARGEDDRKVTPESKTKSISSETTFSTDYSDPVKLQEQLRPLCETVARRLRDKRLAGVTVTVKLKGADFQLLTRSRRLAAPTQQAEAIFEAAAPLVRKEADGRAFRLIGVGVADLVTETEADPPDLFADAGS